MNVENERDFKRCEICKDFHWTDRSCNPEFFVYHEEYHMDDEAQSVRAIDHEEAAEKYGEYYNQDDYALMDDTIEVKVVDDKGTAKYFIVGAEPDIHYTTSEIDPKTKERKL